MNKKIPSYLKNHFYEITRDERYFCSELFYLIKSNPIAFNKYLGITEKYELGFEVAFYRDYIKKYGFYINGKKVTSIRKIGPVLINEKYYQFSQKRTFDLCLFLKNEIILIEAKCQQGFTNSQMKEFKDDKILLSHLLGIEKDKIKIVALVSSKYQYKKDTEKNFDQIIIWKQLYESYLEKHAFLKRADDLYRN